MNQNRTHDHADEAATEPVPTVDLKQALLDNLGGPSGMVYTALPVVVFVTANAFYPLPTTIGIAIAAGLAVTGSLGRLRSMSE